MSVEERLNGNDFIALFRAGHRRLRENMNVVNSLNIFPVPDGDTGTNMELSLAAGVARFGEVASLELGVAAQELANGLLMGARGNSGVILSQLFRGFSKVMGQSTEMDTALFASALHEGVQIAYRAVAKPVEGTILTVAREAAAAGVREAKRKLSWTEWMNQVHAAAQKALEKTPDQLPVLKQAGVVDSGGQGLVFIFEGFLRYLRGENALLDELSEQTGVSVVNAVDFAAAHIDHEGEYGYCTEVLIRLEGHEAGAVEQALRETLSSYGDSLLVVGGEDLVKVHVHTLHPGRALEDALKYGALAKIKIDNMTEQHSEIQTRQGHPGASPGVASGTAGSTLQSRVKKPVAIVAVAAGTGLKEVFLSLGADVVVEGGQTMNPSTEEIVAAVRTTDSDVAIVLPNNKNIIMAAQQAQQVLGERVQVVACNSVPEGIAALVAYQEQTSVAENLHRMDTAARAVHSGQVVRAVRDSVYQGKEIRENQYLGFVNQELSVVADDRATVVEQVIAAMTEPEFELLTVFYGAEVSAQEIESFQNRIAEQFGLEVEVRYGGQPVYDYIFALE